MKIKNKSWSTRVISLAEGKSVIVPARGSLDITEEDFKSPECQRLFAARSIIVLPEMKKKAPVSVPPPPEKEAAAPPEEKAPAPPDEEAAALPEEEAVALPEEEGAPPPEEEVAAPPKKKRKRKRDKTKKTE